MQTALTLGSARATVKHESLVGHRMVVAQPLMLDQSPDGPPLLAIDAFGGGVVITSCSLATACTRGHHQ